MSNDGTPEARFNLLMDELEKRFPGVVNQLSSEPPELRLLEALDKLRKGEEAKLEALLRKVVHMVRHPTGPEGEDGYNLDAIADRIEEIDLEKLLEEE